MIVSNEQQKMGTAATEPTQPDQLDPLLLTSQMESFCEQATRATEDTVAKLYFVNDLLRK